MSCFQEAHGPHRSPEKTVLINKHIQLHHNFGYQKKKTIIFFFRTELFLISTTLNPLYTRVLWAKIG